MSPGVPWPPAAGVPLPRAGECAGVRRKLAGYSLDVTHKRGGSKAHGFERILGITIEHIDYLEGAIQTGVMLASVNSIRENPPYGINCLVMVPLRGRGEKSRRVVSMRTVWTFDHSGAAPRLASAYLRP